VLAVDGWVQENASRVVLTPATSAAFPAKAAKCQRRKQPEISDEEYLRHSEKSV